MLFRILTCIAPATLFFMSGCGQAGPPASAKAEGTVTHQGKPVSTGEIYFIAADKGFAANASLTTEGKFQISTGLPPAQYRVFLTRPRITKPPMAGEPPPEAVEFPVPDKYQSENTSGLSAEIKPGDNTVNFTVD